MHKYLVRHLANKSKTARQAGRRDNRDVADGASSQQCPQKGWQQKVCLHIFNLQDPQTKYANGYKHSPYSNSYMLR